MLLLFPGIFGGGELPAATNPAVDVAPAATVTQAASVGEATKAEDPFASFLVRFGRTNPFAPVGAIAFAKPATQKPGDGQQSTGPTMEDLRKRLQSLAGGGVPNSGSTNPAPGGQAGGGPGGTSGSPGPPGQANEGYVLKGIVRYQATALAVITNGSKVYFVGEGDTLEKTNYAVRKIEEDRVLIVSGTKELVLLLRGKKP